MAATEHNSIQQIADEAKTLRQFYERYLALVCSSLNGIGAVAWDCSSPQFAPIAQVKGSEDKPIRMNVSETRHSDLLRQAITSTDPLVVRPDEKDVNETDHLTILIAKIKRGGTTDLIELFIPGGLAEETNVSRLRELAAMNLQASNTRSMQSAPQAPGPARLAQNLASL